MALITSGKTGDNYQMHRSYAAPWQTLPEDRDKKTGEQVAG